MLHVSNARPIVTITFRTSIRRYCHVMRIAHQVIFRPNAWHSIELNATHKVKEWNDQPVRFALEENAVLLESGWDWIDGRQTQFYLIR